MKCIDFADKLDDFIDDYLPRHIREEMAVHKEICAACQQDFRQEQDLRRLLNNSPVPDVTQASLETMMRGAKREFNNSRRMGITKIIGAIAAGLVIFMATGLYHNNPGNSDHHLQPVAQMAQISKTINLLVNCPTDMEQAELTIILPENVELAGLSGQRQVTWTTDLKAGTNLLPLEIIARTAGTARITARIKHHQKSKTKILNTSI